MTPKFPIRRSGILRRELPAPFRRSQRPHRRLRSGRISFGGATIRLSRRQDLYRRTEAGPVAARPGGRRRLPHRGDVRSLFVFVASRRKPAGCRVDDVLEARPHADRQHHSQRMGTGHRRRTVGISACRPEPGAGARFLPRRHAQIAVASRAGIAHNCSILGSFQPATTPILSGDQARAPRSRAETVERDRRGCVVGCWTGRRRRRSMGARCAQTPPTHLGGHGRARRRRLPDVRFKSLIQSADDGSIIIIPREGGCLFRLYIELDKLVR